VEGLPDGSDSYRSDCDRNILSFSDCLREYERAIKLGANDSTAHWHLGMFLASMCEDPRALGEIATAQQLDPLSLTIRSMAGWVANWFRQYDRAIEQSRSCLEMDENCLQAYYVLGHALLGKRQFHDAVNAFEQAATKFDNPLSMAHLGMACGFMGDTLRAKDILRKLEDRAVSHQ
jgi:tetratricopeptide (TPR) repeat protein